MKPGAGSRKGVPGLLWGDGEPTLGHTWVLYASVCSRVQWKNSSTSPIQAHGMLGTVLAQELISSQQKLAIIINHEKGEETENDVF